MTASRRKTPALTAFALGEPILPIGFLPNGRPVFPIAGGAPDDPPPADPPKNDDPPAFEPITSQEELDRRLGARLAREREKFADYDDLKAAKVEYDKLLDAAKTEQERAVEAARNEGKTEALTVANTRLVSAEARALAAGAKFRDPADAVAFLDLKDVKVNDDGSVDADAIKAKLTTLAETKPYLVDDGKGGKPRPDRSQGGGGDTDKPSVARGRELFEQRHPKKAS